MGLIVYECGRPDHGHEIRQWTAIKQTLYDYYLGRDELALLIINFNVAHVALDGLLLKEDAVILVELKDRSGTITARQNGEWECDDDPMHPIMQGGSGKTVFEQLRVNRRTLSSVLKDNDYLPDHKIKDLQGLVVVTKLDKLKSDFDRETKAWLHVTDVEKIGIEMHDIKSRPYKDFASGIVTPVHLGRKDIFNFIRRAKLDERALVMDYSDAHLLPEDLFHPDSAHNGDAFSHGTVLANNIKQIEDFFAQLNELKKIVVALQSEPEAKSDTVRQRVLLEAKKKLAEKDAEGTALRINLAKQEMEFLEAQFHRAEGRNAPDDEQLELLQKIEEKNIELKGLLSQADVKNDILAHVFDEMENVDTNIADSKEPPVITDEKAHDPHNSYGVLVHNSDSYQKERGNSAFDTSREIMSMPPAKDFDIGEQFMDNDQLDLIERTNDANMLVTGPAGSGKSLIAVHKARQLLNCGENVILIAFTKSLRAFMEQENKSNIHFYHYWKWKKKGCPSADYIIVDEIQDFTFEEILEFIHAAKKYYFFFGDTAQSIMTVGNRKPLSIEDLAKKLELSPLRLYSNYRLPQTVARITQDYVGVGVPKFSAKIYKNNEKELPSIIGYSSQEEELEGLLRIMQKHEFANIGILVADNDSVVMVRDWLQAKGIQVEYKWNSTADWNYSTTLDFTMSTPKIMTYHSAKGLQFQTVIIPLYHGAEQETLRKPLYVAMTRTFRKLYVLHHEPVLAKPLADVPKYLYLTKE